METFISNFKNDNFQKKLFQISKMKIFKNFHFKFSWHISFSSFPSGGMANYFKISIQISKQLFFSVFPFPCGGIGNFSKFKNKNFQFKFEKLVFSKKNHFMFSLWHK
jgi:hypothetical protein